jgi:hypothetical protein
MSHACQSALHSSRSACGTCEDQQHLVRLQTHAGDTRRGLASGYAHPFVLAPEDWRRILQHIRVQGRNELLPFFATRGAVEPAFTQEELEYLGAKLSRAFSQARPDEWVVFALSRTRSPDLTEITSGGWYVTGESLHLVLANYRYAVTMPTVHDLIWEDPLWTKAGPFYDLLPGDHQVLEEESLVHRFLWSDLPSVSIAYKPLLAGEPLPSTAGPAPPSGSVSSPRPGEPPLTPASLEERIQALKRLRDQGLITEEEYQSKKRELLDRF